MSSEEQTASSVNVTTLATMKEEGEKIASLTGYDASFAALLDGAGVDLVLVGDSLGNVIQGRGTTLPVTLEHMIYHTRAVAAGLDRAFLVADMPWMTFNDGPDAADNAGRLMAEGGASMVKLEGGGHVADVTAYLVERAIPVCAHLGLTPQWVHKLGGYRVQGRDQAAAAVMRREAHRLAEAGAALLVLECVPRDLAAEITADVDIPTIGIGAGPDTDGQILVLYDMLGITPGRRPRFVKDFMTGAGNPGAAVAEYVRQVKAGEFPGDEHCY
jgi:3-methyl-2-oxobutanoate hydroxymethyltransferase